MMSDRVFAVAAPRARNSLRDSPHELSSLDNFKRHLKSHLFKDSLVQHEIRCEALLTQLVLLTALYTLSTLLTYLFTYLLCLLTIPASNIYYWANEVYYTWATENNA